jgi:hypothetical protein
MPVLPSTRDLLEQIRSRDLYPCWSEAYESLVLSETGESVGAFEFGRDRRDEVAENSLSVRRHELVPDGPAAHALPLVRETD